MAIGDVATGCTILVRYSCRTSALDLD